ncbi:hypothetical protein Agub_g9858 [Astrephomene gubernaculifera]|uniref:Uncharacterized protein n=1 Tax=Astrephomene gubernaculifera TaxID=47775 RepID=A0AAD3DU32_9CHLO|nr:hypothetical protein Agub_g9858 [Astrephomene gubernaculifera]
MTTSNSPERCFSPAKSEAMDIDASNISAFKTFHNPAMDMSVSCSLAQLADFKGHLQNLTPMQTDQGEHGHFFTPFSNKAFETPADSQAFYTPVETGVKGLHSRSGTSVKPARHKVSVFALADDADPRSMAQQQAFFGPEANFAVDELRDKLTASADREADGKCTGAHQLASLEHACDEEEAPVSEHGVVLEVLRVASPELHPEGEVCSPAPSSSAGSFTAAQKISPTRRLSGAITEGDLVEDSACCDVCSSPPAEGIQETRPLTAVSCPGAAAEEQLNSAALCQPDVTNVLVQAPTTGAPSADSFPPAAACPLAVVHEQADAIESIVTPHAACLPTSPSATPCPLAATDQPEDAAAAIATDAADMHPSPAASCQPCDTDFGASASAADAVDVTCSPAATPCQLSAVDDLAEAAATTASDAADLHPSSAATLCQLGGVDGQAVAATVPEAADAADVKPSLAVAPCHVDGTDDLADAAAPTAPDAAGLQPYPAAVPCQLVAIDDQFAAALAGGDAVDVQCSLAAAGCAPDAMDQLAGPVAAEAEITDFHFIPIAASPAPEAADLQPSPAAADGQLSAVEDQVDTAAAAAPEAADVQPSPVADGQHDADLELIPAAAASASEADTAQVAPPAEAEPEPGAGDEPVVVNDESMQDELVEGSDATGAGDAMPSPSENTQVVGTSATPTSAPGCSVEAAGLAASAPFSSDVDAQAVVAGGTIDGAASTSAATIAHRRSSQHDAAPVSSRILSPKANRERAKAAAQQAAQVPHRQGSAAQQHPAVLAPAAAVVSPCRHRPIASEAVAMPPAAIAAKAPGIMSPVRAANLMSPTRRASMVTKAVSSPVANKAAAAAPVVDQAGAADGSSTPFFLKRVRPVVFGSPPVTPFDAIKDRPVADRVAPLPAPALHAAASNASAPAPDGPSSGGVVAAPAGGAAAAPTVRRASDHQPATQQQTKRPGPAKAGSAAPVATAGAKGADSNVESRARPGARGTVPATRQHTAADARTKPDSRPKPAALAKLAATKAAKPVIQAVKKDETGRRASAEPTAAKAAGVGPDASTSAQVGTQQAEMRVILTRKVIAAGAAGPGATAGRYGRTQAVAPAPSAVPVTGDSDGDSPNKIPPSKRHAALTTSPSKRPRQDGEAAAPSTATAAAAAPSQPLAGIPSSTPSAPDGSATKAPAAPTSGSTPSSPMLPSSRASPAGARPSSGGSAQEQAARHLSPAASARRSPGGAAVADAARSPSSVAKQQPGALGANIAADMVPLLRQPVAVRSPAGSSGGSRPVPIGVALAAAANNAAAAGAVPAKEPANDTAAAAAPKDLSAVEEAAKPALTVGESQPADSAKEDGAKTTEQQTAKGVQPGEPQARKAATGSHHTGAASAPKPDAKTAAAAGGGAGSAAAARASQRPGAANTTTTRPVQPAKAATASSRPAVNQKPAAAPSAAAAKVPVASAGGAAGASKAGAIVRPTVKESGQQRSGGSGRAEPTGVAKPSGHGSTQSAAVRSAVNMQQKHDVRSGSAPGAGAQSEQARLAVARGPRQEEQQRRQPGAAPARLTAGHTAPQQLLLPNPFAKPSAAASALVPSAVAHASQPTAKGKAAPRASTPPQRKPGLGAIASPVSKPSPSKATVVAPRPLAASKDAAKKEAKPARQPAAAATKAPSAEPALAKKPAKVAVAAPQPSSAAASSEKTAVEEEGTVAGANETAFPAASDNGAGGAPEVISQQECEAPSGSENVAESLQDPEPMAMTPLRPAPLEMPAADQREAGPAKGDSGDQDAHAPPDAAMETTPKPERPDLSWLVDSSPCASLAATPYGFTDAGNGQGFSFPVDEPQDSNVPLDATFANAFGFGGGGESASPAAEQPVFAPCMGDSISLSPVGALLQNTVSDETDCVPMSVDRPPAPQGVLAGREATPISLRLKPSGEVSMLTPGPVFQFAAPPPAASKQGNDGSTPVLFPQPKLRFSWDPTAPGATLPVPGGLYTSPGMAISGFGSMGSAAAGEATPTSTAAAAGSFGPGKAAGASSGGPSAQAANSADRDLPEYLNPVKCASPDAPVHVNFASAGTGAVGGGPGAGAGGVEDGGMVMFGGGWARPGRVAQDSYDELRISSVSSWPMLQR